MTTSSSDRLVRRPLGVLVALLIPAAMALPAIADAAPDPLLVDPAGDAHSAGVVLDRGIEASAARAGDATLVGWADVLAMWLETTGEAGDTSLVTTIEVAEPLETLRSSTVYRTSFTTRPPGSRCEWVLRATLVAGETRRDDELGIDATDLGPHAPGVVATDGRLEVHCTEDESTVDATLSLVETLVAGPPYYETEKWPASVALVDPRRVSISVALAGVDLLGPGTQLTYLAAGTYSPEWHHQPDSIDSASCAPGMKCATDDYTIGG